MRSNFLIPRNLLFPVDGCGLQSIYSKSKSRSWYILGSWTTARDGKDVRHVCTSSEWALLGKLQPAVSFICFLLSLEPRVLPVRSAVGQPPLTEAGRLWARDCFLLCSFVAFFILPMKNVYRGITIFRTSKGNEKLGVWEIGILLKCNGFQLSFWGSLTISLAGSLFQAFMNLLFDKKQSVVVNPKYRLWNKVGTWSLNGLESRDVHQGKVNGASHFFSLKGWSVRQCN